MSSTDIVTDVLVLYEFWQLGYMTYFWISLAIFAAAQTSYAFLFTASYASQKSVSHRIIVFFVVLPLSQLVPIFCWLEALQLPTVTRVVNRLGLRSSEEPEDEVSAADADSVWSMLQSKYRSHAGFLAEAFVEAVPQAVLQTVFVTQTGLSSALTVVSVALSVCTIASKGYMVSYALDWPTFLFNFACVAADTFGLFCTTAFLASRFDTSDSLVLLWTWLCCMGLALSVFGGHGALWFAMADDHLKLRDKARWPYGVRGINFIFFDLYIVRTFAWLVALVPCIVVFAVVKLAFIPLCVLRSVDPDLMRHSTFFRNLAGFLLHGSEKDRESRLLTVNSFLAQAHGEKARLSTRLERAATAINNTAHHPQGRVVAWQKASSDAVALWASEVGLAKPKDPCLLAFPRRRVEATEQTLESDAATQRAILESIAMARSDNGKIAELRRQMRRLRMIAFIEDRIRDIRVDLGRRSEVFRAGISMETLRKDTKRVGLLSALLRIIACVALTTAVMCAVPLVLNHIAFIILGLILPLWELPACVSGCCGTAPSLQCLLGSAYLVLVGCAACLVPKVLRNQMLWADVMDLRGFPTPFYGNEIIKQIRWRHERDSFLKRKIGHNLTQHTLSYIEEQKPHY